LSAFYFGYIIAYMSAVDFGTVMEKYSITMKKDVVQGLLVACIPIGGGIGALASGAFINRLSRRYNFVNIQTQLTSSQCLCHSCRTHPLRPKDGNLFRGQTTSGDMCRFFQLHRAFDHERTVTERNLWDINKFQSDFHCIWGVFCLCFCFDHDCYLQRSFKLKYLVDSFWISLGDCNITKFSVDLCVSL
jgi:hypothetical protein